MTATDAFRGGRRRFLAALGCLALPLPGRAGELLVGGAGQRVLLAAAADAGGPFFQAVDGPPLATPTRGHGMLPVPGTSELVLVARRPGEWLWRVDWRRGEVLARAEAAPDRHFYGHAILSTDGRTLFTTENDVATGQGVVGIYDARSLARRGEFPSHGIGPHELLWLEPDRVLAVANGGILTLPETGRMKLNLDRMAPSIVLLEMPGGRLLAEHALQDNTLSLRHLARSADGTLGIAIQAESPDGRPVVDAPLLALLRDGRLSLAEAVPGLGGYGASAAACGNRFLVTALQGHTVAVWGSDGRLQREIGLPRPAGLAVDGNEVLVSNELGLIARLDPVHGTLDPLVERAGVRWDNHLAIVRRAG